MSPEQIENENSLKERDLFFTHSFDALAVASSDGYFKKVNPAFTKILGYSQEQLCAKPIVSFLHPDDVEKTLLGIKKLSEGTPTIASINRYRCSDGTYRWFSWNTTPLGKLFYTVGRDITAQVAAEEQIQKLNSELAKKNSDLELLIQERVAELRRSEAQVQQLQKMDAVGRLAGGIAHDFNNMLGAITLYCDLLAEISDPNSIKDNIENVRDVTDRAAALTRQLLIFSRKQIRQTQIVNLNPLIGQLQKMLVRLIGENITIVTKLADDTKDIDVDPSQIEQVILNLVVNARDAMPNGGKIVIETANVYLDEDFASQHLSLDKGHYVMLSVSDDGIGMDAATLDKIFEPFFTTKPVGKGTGLGLTTTYGIIKQSNGSIWVYSEPGKGSVFKIYLPIAESSAQEVISKIEPLADVKGSHTVLLVEDDDKLRAGFSLMLGKKGYNVFAAANAVEALDICQNLKDPIHLMLTDVVMPGMNGFELSKKAIELRQNLRVLYMSGYTNDALENSTNENLSQIDFIQKPFGTRQLIAKIQEILHRGKELRS